MKYYVLGFLTALTIANLLLFAYLFRRQSTIIKEMSNPITPSVTNPTHDVSPTYILSPTPDTITLLRENAIYALNERKYDELIPYMSSKVTVRWENSTCCVETTASNSIANLRNLNNSRLPWEIAADNSVVENIIAIYPEHYKDAVIALSANNYLIAIKLDNEFKIYKITITTNYFNLLP